MPLKDVVCEGMPEHEGPDFEGSPDIEMQIPMTPSGMNALGDRAALVAGLTVDARHSATPGENSGAIVGARSARQAEGVMGAGDLRLSNEALNEIEPFFAEMAT